MTMQPKKPKNVPGQFAWMSRLQTNAKEIQRGNYALDYTDDDLIICLPRSQVFSVPLWDIVSIAFVLRGTPSFWRWRSNHDTTKCYLSDDDIELICEPPLGKAEKIQIKNLIQELASVPQ